MGLFTKIGRAVLVLLALSAPLLSSEHNRVLFLLQKGHTSEAIDLYNRHYLEDQEHDLELLENMGLTLLKQGTQSSDPQAFLMTLLGCQASGTTKAQPLIEKAIESPNPGIQLVTINLLSKYDNDRANEVINQALKSDFLAIRFEAASILAEKQHPKAFGQIESLMQKLPIEVHPLFSPLFAKLASYSATQTVKRLICSSDPLLSSTTILCVAHEGRDEFLPYIRRTAKRHHNALREASAVAIGLLKDESSLATLQTMSSHPSPFLKIAANQALYRLGREEAKHPIEELAKKSNLFAIVALGEISGSEPLLVALMSHPDIQVRFNAAIALLELRDPHCLEFLSEILVKDQRDLGVIRISSFGNGLKAWKLIPSARQNFAKLPIAFELSLTMREAILTQALDLPEDDFLSLAHHVLEQQQNDLVPHVVILVEQLQSLKAIAFLKAHRRQLGNPLIRNYCNLALYRLREPGPYAETLYQWIRENHSTQLIELRPFVPWEKRSELNSQFQLTAHEQSRLFVDSLEALLQTQDTQALTIILEVIRNGNWKNRYAIAGLLIRATT